MIAVVLGSPAVASLPFSLAFLMVPMLLLFAPQSIRRDRLAVAALVVLALLAIGIPLLAASTNATPSVVVSCAGRWWAIECWF